MKSIRLIFTAPAAEESRFGPADLIVFAGLALVVVAGIQLAWRVPARTPAATAALEAALRRDLPALLARLAPPEPPALSWSVSERTLEVRAAWPAGPR